MHALHSRPYTCRYITLAFNLASSSKKTCSSAVLYDIPILWFLYVETPSNKVIHSPPNSSQTTIVCPWSNRSYMNVHIMIYDNTPEIYTVLVD